MSRPTPDTLSRLRAANPAPVDHELGRGVTAQATLERIISEPPSSPQPTARRVRLRLPRGGLGVTLAVLCLGGGAALAATNPFGWWSSNPSAARYAVDTHVLVRTPTQQQVSCHAAGSGFVCSPGGSGQQYRFVDRVRFPSRVNMITRAVFVKGIAHGQATHRITSAVAARLRADVAAVPDSFFTEFRLALHYATVSTGNGRVPPPGVPEFLVCRNSGSTLSCQNLNGDSHAPIGAGIYGAVPAPDWRPNPHSQSSYGLPPGISFTPTEYRLLIDLGRFAISSSNSGGTLHARAHRVPAPRRRTSP
jgi:hypothetical protein